MIDNVRSSHESEFWKAVEKQKFCDLDLDLFQRIIPQIERIINGFIPDARMEMRRCPPDKGHMYARQKFMHRTSGFGGGKVRYRNQERFNFGPNFDMRNRERLGFDVRKKIVSTKTIFKAKKLAKSTLKDFKTMTIAFLQLYMSFVNGLFLEQNLIYHTPQTDKDESKVTRILNLKQAKQDKPGDGSNIPAANDDGARISKKGPATTQGRQEGESLTVFRKWLDKETRDVLIKSKQKSNAVMNPEKVAKKNRYSCQFRF